MTADTYQAIQIPRSYLGLVEIGDEELPFVDLDEQPYVSSKIEVEGIEYTYERSFPIKGHSAIMPAQVEQLQSQGKRLLVGERNERYYLYSA
jgi:hypothetical protein